MTVPNCFSPSALSASHACRLRLVIASSDSFARAERLISGPEAAVGRLIHRVLERAGRSPGISLEEIFNQEYERAIDEIRRDPRCAHFVDLASTRSKAEWSRLKAWVRARAPRSVVPTSPRERIGGERHPLTGTEVGLESVPLRLRGRADRIRQFSADVFEIREFKTGVTLDDRGEVRKDIALQLRAYGLMLLERRPEANVRLVVDDGEEREIPFDSEARRTARALIRGVVRAMPPPGPARAIELASPGKSCWGCSIRHVCPAYRACAPGWWKQYPAAIEWISNDIWGTLRDVDRDRQVDILLHDDANRRVRIRGLDLRHGINTNTIGRRLWFFALEGTGASRGFDGARFHPRSFHELPRDRLERRAWALQVFIEPENARP